MDIVPRLAQWAENDMRAEGVALDAKYEIERLREALQKIGKTYPADASRLIHSQQQIINLVRSALQQKETE